MSTRYICVTLGQDIGESPEKAAKATMMAIKEFSKFDVALDRMRMTWHENEEGDVRLAFFAPDKEDILEMTSLAQI